jgi:hypothetical protein
MTTSAASGNKAHDTPVAQDEVVRDADEQGGGRERRRRARMRSSEDEVEQGQETRVRGGRADIVTVGVVTILISAWGALIPFVEPIFGFHATGTPSLRWNAAHALLAFVPGAVGVVMGLVVLWAASQAAAGRGRVSLMWAGLITVLCGAWFIVGPRAWPAITTHGVYFVPATPLRSLLYQVGYALGTGVILVVCGGYVMGWASRHQISDSAAVRSDVAPAAKVVLPERVVPRTASARAPVSADSVRRDPASREPFVQQLLNRRQ